MGLFDDAASVISRKSSHSKGHHSSSHKRRSTHSTRSHRSRSRTRSPGARSIAASLFGGDDHHHGRHHSSRASFFGLPNVSTRSFFGGAGTFPLLKPCLSPSILSYQVAQILASGGKVTILCRVHEALTLKQQQTNTAPQVLTTDAPRVPTSSTAPTSSSNASCVILSTTPSATPSRSSLSWSFP